MTTTHDDRRAIVPVRAGDREIGAYVIRADRTTFVPAVDVTVLVLGALAAAAVTAVSVAAGAARRRPPAIGAVTMGPGGWLSLKRSAAPSPRAAAGPRPWWARALRAHRLVVER